MLTIKLSTTALFDQKASCFVVLIKQDASLQDLASELKDVIPHLELLVKQRKFSGKSLQNLSIPFYKNNELHYLILIGLGKRDQLMDVESYRRALGKMVRAIEELKLTSASLQLPDAALLNLSGEKLVQITSEMIHIAAYHFDEYITDKERKIFEPRTIFLCSKNIDKKEFEEGLRVGTIISQAVNNTRYWIDLPPVKLTPVELARCARTVADERNLKITVFNETEINHMGMGGLAAVSRGSHLDCQLVILEYKTTKKDAPTLAFVGKGITFDSGGLSLKPATHMETMKEDMSGAAAVISTLDIIGQLKPDVNVIGITPLAENLPGDAATKPGDIVRFYNGKTAEILNTDAEGRLILADALAYAVKHYKPDAIIDIATLTGACAYALGPFYSGLMSEDEDLIEKIQKAAQTSGDRVWRLPLDDDYKPAIKSAVADISNIGNPKYLAGAITAALFLQNFVNDIPWAHLDIAGTAFDVPDIPYYRAKSATGAGVRLLTDIALNWK